MSYVAEIASAVKAYERKDKSALRAFQRKWFGENAHQSSDVFAEWLFEHNPHRTPTSSPLWLCQRDGIVVGQQASIPVRLKVGEQECRAAWMIDWRVDPAWRLKGVGPALLARYADSSDVLLGIVVEEAAFRAFSRTGWKTIAHQVLFVRPLDPQACAKGMNAPQLLAKVAPRLIVAGSSRVMAAACRRAESVLLEAVASFDERVDALWQKAKADYPVVTRRDYETLHWRFDAIPMHDYYRRFYLMRQGHVIGYIVIRLESWQDGHVVARVVDYFAERRFVVPLLTLVTDEAREAGAVAVFLDRLDRASDAALWRAGFVRVRASDRFMLKVRPDAAALTEELQKPANWFVTFADSDTDYIAIDEAVGRCALR